MQIFLDMVPLWFYRQMVYHDQIKNKQNTIIQKVSIHTHYNLFLIQHISMISVLQHFNITGDTFLIQYFDFCTSSCADLFKKKKKHMFIICSSSNLTHNHKVNLHKGTIHELSPLCPSARHFNSKAASYCLCYKVISKISSK